MSLRRILILDQVYPSADNLYSDVFVHVRAKGYAEHAEVLVASYPNTRPDWTYEGISVRSFSSIAPLLELIAAWKPDVIAVHFAEGPIITDVLLKTRVPFVVWIHGFEALGWYRRLFNLSGPAELPRLAVFVTRRLLRFRQLITHSRRTGRGVFITPSRWLLRAAQIDMLCPMPHAEAVPNPIDCELFRYVEKGPELRTRVMLLRSFESRIRATDVAVDTIVRLSRDARFASFQFDLYGRGKLFAAAAARLAPYANVNMYERFVPNREIPALHAEHGVLLCPSRQDTQGVTMCEAMASGLVPLTTRVSGIPEFVTHGASGFLTSSSEELANALLTLHDDPALFQRMSRAAAKEVRRKCAAPKVIGRELEILERAASQGAEPS